jgi:anti-sigma B factor antagonist
VAEIGYFRRMVDGVPVVAAPAEIDITTAEQLDVVLLAAVSSGHRTVVGDMRRTRFCDCRALHTLLRAHERMAADGGHLRLVMPAAGAVPLVVSLTGLDRLIPCFGSLEEALKDIGYPVRLMIGIPIVSAPAVINAVTADRLQMVLPRCGPDREARREPGVCSFLSSPRDIARSGINLSTAQDMGLP